MRPQTCAMKAGAGSASSSAKAAPIPDTRYVCLDCLSTEDAADAPESVDFCEECFKDATAAHSGAGAGAGGGAGGGKGAPAVKSHLHWLQIDGLTGNHAVVRRDVADGAVFTEVTVKNLVVLERKDQNAEKQKEAGASKDGAEDGDGDGNGDDADADADDDDTCKKCWVYEISADNPSGVCPPGCHDPEHSCCAEGTLQFLWVQGKLHYIAAADGSLPPATYFCSKCHVADQEQKLREGVVAELVVVLKDWTPTWTAADAARAVERAPSLVGRGRVHSFAKAEPSSSVSKLAVAEWTVKELKEVHSGKANRHIHKALDASLEEIDV